MVELSRPGQAGNARGQLRIGPAGSPTTSPWSRIGPPSAKRDDGRPIRELRVTPFSAPADAPDPLVEPDVHARGFRQAREARRSELVEDYLELISDLIRSGGEARQVDIAARLGVAQPTVAKMLRRLAEEGLVVQRPYRGVFLTAVGEEVADAARSRHHLVESFLLAIGVCPETARRDAEGIEHHVSEETLHAFKAFLARAEAPPSARAESGQAG